MARQFWDSAHTIWCRGKAVLFGGLVLAVAVGLAVVTESPRTLAADQEGVDKGREIFRFDTFGDEQLAVRRLAIFHHRGCQDQDVGRRGACHPRRKPIQAKAAWFNGGRQHRLGEVPSAGRQMRDADGGE